MLISVCGEPIAVPATSRCAHGVLPTKRCSNCAAVIVAHNHPSGIAEPSRADELITQRVKEALALVDIRLLDHIIVGDGASVSLAERGLL